MLTPSGNWLDMGADPCKGLNQRELKEVELILATEGQQRMLKVAEGKFKTAEAVRNHKS